MSRRGRAARGLHPPSPGAGQGEGGAGESTAPEPVSARARISLVMQRGPDALATLGATLMPQPPLVIPARARTQQRRDPYRPRGHWMTRCVHSLRRRTASFAPDRRPDAGPLAVRDASAHPRRRTSHADATTSARHPGAGRVPAATRPLQAGRPSDDSHPSAGARLAHSDFPRGDDRGIGRRTAAPTHGGSAIGGSPGGRAGRAKGGRRDPDGQSAATHHEKSA